MTTQAIRLAQAEKLLAQFQWTGNYHYALERGGIDVPSHCPDCGNEEKDGHTEHCELARFLGADPATLRKLEEAAG